MKAPLSSRTPRRGLFALAITAAVGGLAGSGPAYAAAADSAAAGPQALRAATSYVVVNAPSGVYLRNDPNWNYPELELIGINNGDSVNLYCYEFGGSAGPYSNTLWYKLFDASTDNGGWVSDHYLNTPGTAAAPDPQGSPCHEEAGYGSGSDGYSGRIFHTVGSGTWSDFPTSAELSSVGFGSGDSINLGCFMFGAPDGPYSNVLWYLAHDQSNNTYGWINDHDLNTPGTASEPQPQTEECDPAWPIEE